MKRRNKLTKNQRRFLERLHNRLSNRGWNERMRRVHIGLMVNGSVPTLRLLDTSRLNGKLKRKARKGCVT